jgi:AraC family transcriptional activator of mar-sox-rob regulon
MTVNLEESSGWHSHEVYELLYCMKGQGNLILENRDIEFQSGRFIIIMPEAKHRFLFRNKESADLKILCLTSADTAIHLSSALSVWLRNIKDTFAVFSDHEENGELSELVSKIPDSLGETEKKDLDIIWSRIGLILALHFKRQDHTDIGNQGRHLNTIRNICDWIDRHLEEPLDIDTIASESGMSRSLLTREFRKYTSTSVVEYMNIRRLQKAGAILSGTEKSIAEAAFESGFSNIGNFYRKFKGLYGVTPAEFRKKLTMSEAVQNSVSVNQKLIYSEKKEN